MLRKEIYKQYQNNTIIMDFQDQEQFVSVLVS